MMFKHRWMPDEIEKIKDDNWAAAQSRELLPHEEAMYYVICNAIVIDDVKKVKVRFHAYGQNFTEIMDPLSLKETFGKGEIFMGTYGSDDFEHARAEAQRKSFLATCPPQEIIDSMPSKEYGLMAINKAVLYSQGAVKVSSWQIDEITDMGGKKIFSMAEYLSHHPDYIIAKEMPLIPPAREGLHPSRRYDKKAAKKSKLRF